MIIVYNENYSNIKTTRSGLLKKLILRKKTKIAVRYDKHENVVRYEDSNGNYYNQKLMSFDFPFTKPLVLKVDEGTFDYSNRVLRLDIPNELLIVSDDLNKEVFTEAGQLFHEGVIDNVHLISDGIMWPIKEIKYISYSSSLETSTFYLYLK